ncbi:hypothetical protein G6F59_015245 [Rhizopus arrhizus]|nr:hypothetical protein G6F59_015245 [Rhizopus arrhizus]
MPLLAEAGIEVTESPESSRKLILPTSDPGLRLIIVRASDVPTYVQYGAADLGIAGKDVLIEHAKEQPGGLYQPIDLNIAKCRLAVAVRNGFDYEGAVHQGARLRVATNCMVRWNWRRWSAWPTASSTWCPPAARCVPTTWSPWKTSCRSRRAGASTRPRDSPAAPAAVAISLAYTPAGPAKNAAPGSSGASPGRRPAA